MAAVGKYERPCRGCAAECQGLKVIYRNTVGETRCSDGNGQVGTGAAGERTTRNNDRGQILAGKRADEGEGDAGSAVGDHRDVAGANRARALRAV